MPYILYKTNGKKLVTVEDGSIDQTTDLIFVGKNYAGYGQILNQNLLKLLENFANTASPTKPLAGQIWYDSANKKIKFYDGSKFRAIGGAETSTITPSGLSKGDFWYDELNKKLYINTGTGFLFIGPTVFGQESTVSVNGVLATANNDNTYYVLEHNINGNIVAVSSGDEFIPKTTDPLNTTYDIIKQGISLPYADSTTGVSSNNGYYFWGSAADSVRLGGIASGNYLLKTELASQFSSDDGILLGNLGVFRLHANSSLSEAKLSAVYGTKISFNLLYPNLSGTVTNIISIVGNQVVPNPALSVDLGAAGSGNAFSTVYANKFSAGSTTTAATIDGVMTLNGSLNVLNSLTSTVITSGSTTTNGTLSGVWNVNGYLTASGPTGQLRLNGRDNNSQHYYSYVNSDIFRIYSGTGAADVLKLNSSGNMIVTGYFIAGGNVTAFGNVNAFSDVRLKSNIQTITNALDKTSKLRGVSYIKDDRPNIGLIAQEVEEIIPEVVEDGEYKSISYGNLVGLLIEAIKELKSEVDELKSKIK